jgi:hypothetical protein
MSLIDRATELEYYPEQQLIQMSQDPQGQYPQFLVLSEIQRRNNMRRMYQNEVNKMNQPSTTVAEEAVMEFAGQGAVPMMDASSSLSSTSEGGLRSMAPIPMKSGTKTKIQPSYSDLISKLSESELKMVNQAVMKDRTARMTRDLGGSGKLIGGGVNLSEQALSFLGGSGGNVPIFKGSPEEKKFIEVASNIIANRTSNVSSKNIGGLTQMQSGGSTALEQSFVAPGRNPIPMSAASSSNLRGGLSNIAESLGLIDEEGNIDPVQASLLGLTFVPGLGLVAGAGRLGLSAAKFLAPKVKSLFMKPNPVRAKGLQPGQRVVIDPKKGLDSKKLIDTTTGKVIPEEVLNVNRLLGTAGTIASPFAISNIYAPDDTSVEQGDSDDRQLTAEELEIQRLKKALEEANKIKSSSKPAKKGLSADDALTLAQIGGVFGGAKNLGEAAVGLGNLAAQIQKTRREDVAEGLQGRLVEANIAKLEADIANMEPQQIINEQNAISSLLKQVNEGAVQLSDQDLNNLIQQYLILQDRLNSLRGVEGIRVAGGKNVAEGIPGASIGT